MKKLISILILFVVFAASAALPPILRNSATTNTIPTIFSATNLTGSVFDFFRTNRLFVRTNLSGFNSFDNRRTISISNGANSTTFFVLTNTSLRDLIITNLAVGFNQASVFGGSTNTALGGDIGFISLRGVSVFSQSQSAHFDGRGGAVWKGLFSDCDFHSGNVNFSSHKGDSTFNNCQFYCDHLLSEQKAVSDSSLAFEANDDSTNVFNSCLFQYGGSTNESVGFIPFLSSKSTFNNCLFKSVTNAALQTAIYLGEHYAIAAFNGCTFELKGGMLGVQYSGVADSATVYLNGCNLSPYTNGIVFDNYSESESCQIYVTGGNIKPENFKYQNRVYFQTFPKDYAQLTGQTSLTIAGSGDVITNYSTSAYSGMSVSSSRGTITNRLAGLYKVNMSGLASINGAGSIIVRTNLVSTHIKLVDPDVVSSVFNYSLSGILSIPAGCRIDLFDEGVGNVWTSRMFSVEAF